MIKNSIKKLMVLGLFVGVVLSAYTLENYNKHIAGSKHPDEKQVLLCERESDIFKKNPQECLKAVEMLLKSKKNLKHGYRFEYFGISEAETKVMLPDVFKKTDKEFIDQKIAGVYSNAGFIYNALSQHERKVKMYKKALEYEPSNESAHVMLGLAYVLGKGFEVNKIKAYEHWSVAAKQGNEEAQENLDILCRQSPWACK